MKLLKTKGFRLIILPGILIISITILFISYKKSCSTSNNTADTSFHSFELPAPAFIDGSVKNRLSDYCNNWYDQFLQRSEFNGGMIVAQQGNIIFEKYNGSAHLHSIDVVNANTPFHIASVSKTFTAMAVLKLWQDNKINIDDLFSKYFPNFNYPGITIRSLLSQRSGLPNYVYFMDELGWDKKKYVTNNDILNYLINRKADLKNVERPNTHFNYCNTNYALLALLIEKVTQTSYPEYLRKTIFVPLGMNNTFVYSDKDSAKTNPSYDWKGREAAFIDVDKVYGDKNIFSTPQDLLKWDQLLRTESFLSKSTLDEAYKPYSNERPGVRNYGLGWRMYNFPNGKKIIYHNGWWHGSNAVFIRLLEEQATIIVIGNKYNRNIYKAKDLIGIFTQSFSTDGEEE